MKEFATMKEFAQAQSWCRCEPIGPLRVAKRRVKAQALFGRSHWAR
jgi:hypothetical protein